MSKINTQVIEAHFRISIDDPMLILSVTESVYELLGFKADDFLTGHITLESLIHPHDQEIADEIYATEIKLATSTFNIRLRQYDGRIRCIKGHYTKVFDVNSSSVILDLLLQDAKSLWQHQCDQTIVDNFKAMMENTSDYIYFKDNNHVFTGASQSLLAITKASNHWEDLLGKTDYDVFPEIYADKYYNLEKLVFAGVQMAQEIQETLDKQGNKGWVDNRKYPIRNDEGIITGLFGVARDITELKRLEDSKQAAGSLLQKIAQQVPGMVYQYRLSPNGHASFTFASEGIRTIYRISPEEAREDAFKVLEIIHPDDLTEMIHSIKKSAHELTLWHHEYRVKFDDNTVRWLLGNAMPSLEADGSVLWHGLITDISERKKAEISLNAAEAFTKSILNSVTDEIAVIDDSGVIVAVNASWLKFANENALEIKKSLPNTEIGGNYLQACRVALEVSSENGMNAHEGIRAVLDGRIPKFYLEYPCHSPHQKRWFSMTVSPLEHEWKGVVIAHTNITERIQAELNLQIAATVFESQEGMLVTDTNGTILRVNSAFTKITGYSSEEAIGSNPRLLKSTYHDANFYIALWKSIHDQGFYEGELWNRRKNGQIYPEQLTITAVKNNTGNTTHYVATFTDISSRKAIEARVGFLANHDRLTELPNRELFYDRLSQAISQARRKVEGVAVLFLDLDGFKPINDTYGHEAGDVVLKVVSKRLQASVRDMDTVARMGGDEFAVILTALQKPVDLKIIAQKIIHNISEVIKLDATTSCVVGISIGIAAFPDNGSEIDKLMNAADAAMYESKGAGKNTYTISMRKNTQQKSDDGWISLDEIPLLGLQIIDDQHIKLVYMINDLNESLKHTNSIEKIDQLLEDLIKFTKYHFKTEEHLMHEYGYIEAIEHQNAHEHLLNEIAYLKLQFKKGGELVLLQKLKDWFNTHIVSSDKDLADFIIQHHVK